MTLPTGGTPSKTKSFDRPSTRAHLLPRDTVKKKNRATNTIKEDKGYGVVVVGTLFQIASDVKWKTDE